MLKKIREYAQEISSYTAFWPLVGATGLSGVVAAWAATATKALTQYAPMSWVVCGFAGAAIFILLALVWTFVVRMMRINKLAKDATEGHTASPLSKNIDGKIVRLSDFFSPYYIPHKGKHIINSKIIGPGSVVFSGVLNNNEFRHCQIVIVRTDKQIWGITAFDDCNISRCELVNLTLMMSKEYYDSLPHDMRLHIPVINYK